MGMTAAMKLKQIVRNTRNVLAIELLAAARALDCLSPLRSSPAIEGVRSALQAVSLRWTGDRPLTRDIESVGDWIAGGALLGR
jgi:histidine ammonia-lyase